MWIISKKYYEHFVKTIVNVEEMPYIYFMKVSEINYKLPPFLKIE